MYRLCNLVVAIIFFQNHSNLVSGFDLSGQKLHTDPNYLLSWRAGWGGFTVGVTGCNIPCLN